MGKPRLQSVFRQSENRVLKLRKNMRILYNILFLIGVKKNNIFLVKTNLEHGANVNWWRRFNVNVLYSVIENGNEQLLELLIEYGVDLKWYKKDKLAPFAYACRCGNAAMIKMFVDSGYNLACKEANDICQELAARDRFYTLKYLLKQGLNINLSVCEDRTGLHWAVQEGYMRIVKLLVENGADVNAFDGHDTPLRLACADGKYEMAKYLLENHALVDSPIDDTPLIIASCGGYIEIVKLLLEYGAEIDRKNRDGRSALFFAKAHRQTEVARLLIENGSDIELVDEFGISIQDLDKKSMRKKAIWDLD